MSSLSRSFVPLSLFQSHGFNYLSNPSITPADVAVFQLMCQFKVQSATAVDCLDLLVLRAREYNYIV